MKQSMSLGVLAVIVFCTHGLPVDAQVVATAGPGPAGTVMERTSVFSDAERGSAVATVALETSANDPVGQQLQTVPNRMRGALWGGGIGLVAGGILGGLSVESESDGELGGGLVEASATGGAVLVGAVLGATVGALLGATVLAPSVVVEGGYEVRFVPVATLRGVGLHFEVR